MSNKHVWVTARCLKRTASRLVLLAVDRNDRERHCHLPVGYLRAERPSRGGDALACVANQWLAPARWAFQNKLPSDAEEVWDLPPNPGRGPNFAFASGAANFLNSELERRSKAVEGVGYAALEARAAAHGTAWVQDGRLLSTQEGYIMEESTPLKNSLPEFRRTGRITNEHPSIQELTSRLQQRKVRP